MLLIHKSGHWDCYGTVCLTPSPIGIATQNTLSPPCVASIGSWQGSMTLLACSSPTPPELRSLCSTSGVREETGMTHNFQRTFSSYGTHGRVNSINSHPSLSHGVHRAHGVQQGTYMSTSIQTIHIFSDASARAYGSVAYLWTVDQSNSIQVAFLAARSRVAPVRQQSIPRLELCAAHTGAQLAAVLKRELTLTITSITYWTDSSTVLNWLQSQSCRYKLFVGTRVTDIQELTEGSPWRYVSSADNPVDDITRGLTLSQLLSEHR